MKYSASLLEQSGEHLNSKAVSRYSEINKLKGIVGLVSGLIFTACGSSVEVEGDDSDSSTVSVSSGMGGGGGEGGSSPMEDFCVNVETAAEPESASIASCEEDVRFACWEIINNCKNDKILKELLLNRYGAGSSDDIENVKIYDQDKAITDFSSLEGDKVQFENVDLTLLKGVNKTICAKVNFAEGIMAGGVHGLEIQKAADVLLEDAVTSEPSKVEGQFPLKGPEFLIINGDNIPEICP